MSKASQNSLILRRKLYRTCAVVFVVVLAYHVWCVSKTYVPLPRSFGSELWVEFAWNAANGVTTLSIKERGGRPTGSPLWQTAVAAQVKPRLNSYLKLSPLSSLNGGACVFVSKVIPLAYPDSWGSDCFVIRSPRQALVRDNHVENKNP